MTFYELEKKCKKKRLIKILIFSVLILCLGSGVFYFITKRKKEIKPVVTKPVIKKIVKEVKRKKSFIKNKQKQITILPDIDLNVTHNNTKDKLKPLKNKELKKQKETNISSKQKIVLKAYNLPSYQTCISIAKKYLRQKDYQNALKWAKYANMQNKKIPDSWIVSAKALYFSGKKDEALKLLKIYNKYYNNKNIEKLIKEMYDK